jgi:hypothetical protein
VGIDWFSAAAKLFHEMQREIGLAEARRIFTEIGTPWTAKQRRIIKNMLLLARYDAMMPKSKRAAACAPARRGEQRTRERRPVWAAGQHGSARSRKADQATDR